MIYVDNVEGNWAGKLAMEKQIIHQIHSPWSMAFYSMMQLIVAALIDIVVIST